MKIEMTEKEFKSVSNALDQIINILEAGPNESDEKFYQEISQGLNSLLKKYKRSKES